MMLKLMHYKPVNISKITDAKGMHNLIPVYLNAFTKEPDDTEQVSGEDKPGNNSKGISW